MIILSIEKGREHLRKYGAEHRVMEFEVSSATVELAAKAVGTEGKRIAKDDNLSFGFVSILVSGSSITNNNTEEK